MKSSVQKFVFALAFCGLSLVFAETSSAQSFVKRGTLASYYGLLNESNCLDKLELVIATTNKGGTYTSTSKHDFLKSSSDTSTINGVRSYVYKFPVDLDKLYLVASFANTAEFPEFTNYVYSGAKSSSVSCNIEVRRNSASPVGQYVTLDCQSNSAGQDAAWAARLTLIQLGAINVFRSCPNTSGSSSSSSYSN